MTVITLLEKLFNSAEAVSVPYDDAASFLVTHELAVARLRSVEDLGGSALLTITEAGRVVMACVLSDREERAGKEGDFEAVEPASTGPVTLTRPALPELAKVNREKLVDLAEVYGINQEAVLNLAVSELYDAKLANYRDAAEED